MRAVSPSLFVSIAILLRAAGHTARAGFYSQVVGIDHLHRVASLHSLLLHDAEHLRDQSLLSRTSVYDQYVHGLSISNLNTLIGLFSP